MSAVISSSAGRRSSISHQQRRVILGVLIVLCIASTGAHYTHNYMQIEHYPRAGWVGNETIKTAILVAWPALTACGVFGFWLYSRRRYVAAYPLLAAFALLGLATPGHFTAGNPHIPPFWYATIFTDAALGIAIVAFAHWSAVTARDVADAGATGG